VEISIQIANIGPRDLGTLSKVFGILQGSGIEVTTSAGPTARATPKAEPVAAAEPAKKARAGKAAKPAKGTPRMPKVPDGASLEDTYSRYTRNSNLYSAAERKTWDPILEETIATYIATAGDRAQGGRTIKNWSINRLRAETEAVAGGAADAEGSPSPGKRARGRPAKAAKKAGRAKRKK